MQDEHGGLQRFLFEWMGWPRQQILNTKGAASEVYFENLAPLFYIDQDEGWTDLQALQVGRYGQQQIAEIALEYLLGATDAINARVGKQLAVLREAALRESARTIADRVTGFFLRQGWEANWTGHGSIQDTITRWSLRGLRDVLLLTLISTSSRATARKLAFTSRASTITRWRRTPIRSRLMASQRAT